MVLGKLVDTATGRISIGLVEWLEEGGVVVVEVIKEGGFVVGVELV